MSQNLGRSVLAAAVMLIRRLLPKYNRVNIDSFRHRGMTSPLEDIQAKYAYSGDLAQIYSSPSGLSVTKWHHYIPIYDKHMSSFRGKRVRMLEIGVHKGGSLRMWRKYFGEKAVLFGIDIDERVATLNNIDGQVRVGAQSDEIFMKGVVDEMGGVDIVLDDGSHRMDDIKSTFESIFPLLAHGGLYIIEDLHTAYWNDYGGGSDRKGNFFNYVNNIIHDMHHWYHDKPQSCPGISECVFGIHVYDSILVIEKSLVHMPVYSSVL